MKIAVITCHSPYNYGAVLQCYALLSFLRKLGHEPIVIDYQTPKISSSPFYRLARYFVRYLDFQKCNKVFSAFSEKEIPRTRPYKNFIDLMKEPPLADMYMAGSDQIWNMKLKNGWDASYYLAFAPKEKPKISYASSVGENQFCEQEIQHLKKMLSSFDAISVREEKTANILCEHGVLSQSVLDPVFLLTKEEWIAFQNQQETLEEPYILVYSFYRRKDVYTYARKLADQHHAKVYVISTLLSDKRFDMDRFFWVVDPQTFIQLFQHAKSVVTNSYHGILFSLLFEKPFHVFDSISGMDRIHDILQKMECPGRIVTTSNLLDEELDWDKIGSLRHAYRRKSEEYLEKAIQGEYDVGK